MVLSAVTTHNHKSAPSSPQKQSSSGGPPPREPSRCILIAEVDVGEEEDGEVNSVLPLAPSRRNRIRRRSNSMPKRLPQHTKANNSNSRATRHPKSTSSNRKQAPKAMKQPKKQSSSKKQLIFQSPRCDLSDDDLFPHSAAAVAAAVSTASVVSSSRASSTTVGCSPTVASTIPSMATSGTITSGSATATAAATTAVNALRYHSRNHRWDALSEQAGSHQQDGSVYRVNKRLQTAAALQLGMPQQAAARVRTLFLPPAACPAAAATASSTTATTAGDSSLPEWLDVVVATFPNLKHLHVTTEGAGNRNTDKKKEAATDGDKNNKKKTKDSSSNEGAAKSGKEETAADRNQEGDDDDEDSVVARRLRRLYVLYRLPDLESIDGVPVSSGERQLARPPGSNNGQKTPTKTKVQRNDWVEQSQGNLNVEDDNDKTPSLRHTSVEVSLSGSIKLHEDSMNSLPGFGGGDAALNPYSGGRQSQHFRTDTLDTLEMLQDRFELASIDGASSTVSNNTNALCGDWACGSLTLPYFRPNMHDAKSRLLERRLRGKATENKPKASSAQEAMFRKQQQSPRPLPPPQLSKGGMRSWDEVELLRSNTEPLHADSTVSTAPSSKDDEDHHGGGNNNTAGEEEEEIINIELQVAQDPTSDEERRMLPPTQEYLLEHHGSSSYVAYGGSNYSLDPCLTPRAIAVPLPSSSGDAMSPLHQPNTTSRHIPGSVSLTSPFPMQFRAPAAVSASPARPMGVELTITTTAAAETTTAAAADCRRAPTHREQHLDTEKSSVDGDVDERNSLCSSSPRDGPSPPPAPHHHRQHKHLLQTIDSVDLQQHSCNKKTEGGRGGVAPNNSSTPSATSEQHPTESDNMKDSRPPTCPTGGQRATAGQHQQQLRLSPRHQRRLLRRKRQLKLRQQQQQQSARSFSIMDTEDEGSSDEESNKHDVTTTGSRTMQQQPHS